MSAHKTTEDQRTLPGTTEYTLTELLPHLNGTSVQTIFDNIDTGYALIDPAFRLVSYNQPIYKFSVEQLEMPLEAGRHAADFFRPDRWAFVSSMLQKTLKGNTNKYEISYPQPDGSVKWFEAGCTPVFDNGKKIIGIIMSETDITKRKVSELQEKLITSDLIQRNIVLEQFAYIISHNLRSPITTIMGIADLMKDNDISNQDKEFFIHGIVESVKKLDTVIIDLNSALQFKNTENENKEPVCFAEILADVASGLKSIIDDSELTIKTNFEEVSTIVTLKSYIHSIFYNLISNSIKYRQPAVPLVIEISSKRTKNKIELIFKDNGLGIDLEKKGSQVFGLYKRFHVDAAEGKGMGLFMVRTQVETLGGRISVKSEVNVGTEFRIEFDQQA